MLLELATSPRKGRTKLGLALAGGGFRASLFHVGVLESLARLDLLGRVEVLSTVSGGSIVGALYYLLLKERMNRAEPMTPADALAVVERTRDLLIAGIRKDLRNRLLSNPAALLASLTTARGLADSMAALYDRHLYRPAAGLEGIRLRQLRFRPGGSDIPDLEAHNRAARWKVPALIVNATSLNSGSPFRFSITEIGEPQLGYFRRDEIERELLPRKRLLEEISLPELTSLAERSAPEGTLSPLEIGIALWWRARSEAVMTAGACETRLPAHARDLPALYEALDRAPLGLLRAAKLAAWYLLVGLPAGFPGAYEPSEYRRFFWRAVREIDEPLAADLEESLGSAKDPSREGAEDDLLRLFLNVYYLRSARQLSRSAATDFDALTLARAVGASACFPPVFPPLRLRGVYDDAEVSLLGLTDGGVYDNVGITALLQEGCTHIIASDTGSAFDTHPAASTGRLGMVSRISNILMNVVGNEQRTRLRAERRMNRTLSALASPPEGPPPCPAAAAPAGDYTLRGLAYCQITAGGPESNATAVSRLRTDLDAFGEIEADALIAHGRVVAHDQVTAYIDPRDFVDLTPPTGSPEPERATEPPWRIARVLAAGRHRFGRALRLGSVPAWTAAALALAALSVDVAGGLTRMRTVLEKLWRVAFLWTPALADGVARLWRTAAPWQRVAIFLAPFLLAALWRALSPRAGRKISRKTSALGKWLRLLAGNALWILGPIPLVLAALGSAIGALLYLFDGRPALRKTRRSA